MSFWLKNVGNFLDKLDDRAERVVEEQQARLSSEDDDQDDDFLQNEDGERFGRGREAVDSILAARGLVIEQEGEGEEEDENAAAAKEEAGEKGEGATVEAGDVPKDNSVGGLAVAREEDLLGEASPEESDHEQGERDDDDAHDATSRTVAGGDGSDGREAVAEPEPAEGKDAGSPPEHDAASASEIADGKDRETSETETSVEKESEHGMVAGEESARTTSSGVNAEATEESASEVGRGGSQEEERASGETPPVQATVTTSASSSTGAPLPSSRPSSVPLTPPRAAKASSPSKPPPPPSSQQHLAVAKEAQKEARTLRRHVVSLNAQLEKAEAEVEAQRKELDRAAERMEKDRTRHKEDREKEKGRHTEEIKNLRSQHDQTVREIRQRAEGQLEAVREQLRDVEERRMREGGDWNKEVADAVRREAETARKLASIEDEKSTLLSQISTLQAQQEALGSRLESLTHTADSAMERERDAEDRLDEALSLHARQISQRQAREAELERTISELGAALVAARETQAGGSKDQNAPGRDRDGGDGDGTGPWRSRLQTAENELDNLRAQLDHERQRCETLQRELRDVSNERTQETSVAHTRQLQHDREVAELSQSLSRVKQELRESKEDAGRALVSSESGGSIGDGGDDGNQDARRIKNLSEEVLKQRETVINCNSEISALKSRLRVALDRANKAEATLEEGNSNGNGSGNWHDVEGGGGGAAGMRRRGLGGAPRSRGAPDSAGGSIRAALRLDAVRGENTERIGKGLDALDSFLVRSGRFLRYNPLARLIFIVYLLVLHLWCFAVLFLHAHSFETVHGDFGSGGNLPHGPSALMQQQQQNVQAAAAAAQGNQPPKPHGD